MAGVVGLLGGAMGVTREGEGRKRKIYQSEPCCSTPGLEQMFAGSSVAITFPSIHAYILSGATLERQRRGHVHG